MELLPLGRQDAREIINEVSSYKPGTTYRVLDGRLWVRADGGLTEEQIIFCTEFRDLLIEYLTTPPDESGTCGRCGAAPVWKLLPTGIWVCSCIDTPRDKLVSQQTLVS